MRRRKNSFANSKRGTCEVKFPYLHEADIEAAAKRLLAAAFGTDQRIDYPLDLETLVYDYLCDREGLVFDDERDLGGADGDIILGMMRPFQNEILITAPLRRDGPEGRYRFTVAHEIGHWVLHRPLFFARDEQGDLFTGTADQKGTLMSLNRNVFPKRSGYAEVPPEEWQANRFAIELLLDESILHTAFVERFGDPPVPRRRGDGSIQCPTLRELARRIGAEVVQGRQSLKDLFGLSIEAMAIALESRGYVIEGPVLI